MTGGVAHDFNNLLTVVSGSLQLLDMSTRISQSAREIINSALHSGAAWFGAHRQAAHFARRAASVAASRGPMCCFTTETLLCARSATRSASGSSVHLDSRRPSPIRRYWTVRYNLALNARDAMPEWRRDHDQAQERWLTADPTRPEQRAWPPHDLYRGRYRTWHDAGGAGPCVRAVLHDQGHWRGSGLGLSMVYGFVKQRAATCAWKASPDKARRSSCSCRLPRWKRLTAAPESTADVRGSELVLVVEDQPEVRNIAAAFLRSLGYRVIAVGNAADAFAQLAVNEDIALLFSDVMLGGGMNGIELAQAARSLRPQLGVLLASGYDEPATTATVTPPPFELIRKPYRREQLAAALRRSLAPLGDQSLPESRDNQQSP
jgi:CheY-like chemotaxis protein